MELQQDSGDERHVRFYNEMDTMIGHTDSSDYK